MKTSKSTTSSVAQGFSIVAVFCTALTFSQTTEASLIVWGTPVAINKDNPLQVSTNGTFVLAEDGNTSRTVNGVTFTPTNWGTHVTNLSGHVGGGYGPQDTQYALLVAGFSYRGSGGTSNIALTSLMIGQQYEVQIFTPYWDANYESKFSDGLNSVNMGNTQTAPTYVIGTFTADATTKNVSFDAAAGSPYGLLSSFQVRAIPEPSTFVLLSLGGLFALRKLRRSRS